MVPTDATDNLFAQPLGEVPEFSFDRRVAGVFADMIGRSVPGYATILSTSGLLASRYAQADTHLYDLGCSLGAGLLAAHRGGLPETTQLIGVDNSDAMLTRCDDLLAVELPAKRFALRCEDVRNTALERASVVLLNFTLQFLPVADREHLIERIYRALEPGGCLILSEKIAFGDASVEDCMTDMHHRFKRAQGYSELEISQKRSALEAVLIPEPLSGHQARLQRAGFEQHTTWFQCFNFVSLLAIK